MNSLGWNYKILKWKIKFDKLNANLEIDGSRSPYTMKHKKMHEPWGDTTNFW